MSPSSRPRRSSPSATATSVWQPGAELVGLVITVQPQSACTLYPQYPIGLHAWFLDQVRQSHPDLSAHLHDEQTEKPFTLSALIDPQSPYDRPLSLSADRPYQWFITALSPDLTQWLKEWVSRLPPVLELRHAPLLIQTWAIAHPATTYDQLFTTAITESSSIAHSDSRSGEAIDPNPDQRTLPSLTSFNLSFISPTSFRHRKHHLPLPVPENVFHSYLRRWNLFSKIEFDTEDYLDWIDETAIIVRHQLRSQKVLAGKRGSVTGFTGAVQFGLVPQAHTEPEFVQLFRALGGFAPYCGTGHKTTFGLGQTRLGWQDAASLALATTPTIQDLLSQRTAELTDRFLAQRKRLGGDRATQIAETWATILARRELGESLQTIATDLQMPYETVKTYAKKARKAAIED
ncbi:MAG: CRISPR-associated endoribonuclease Cas6 [Cyanobacteria bacterium CRU_2_1]|nr:CRISPR-associated endoribonuclease Cas6 [Cyanobacteria bacterium CRU_2_1]